MPDQATIEQEAKAFVDENFPLASEAEALGPEDSLITAGVIDSTGVLELIGFLESRYGFEIADEEVLPENLDSIRNIGRFVVRKLDSGEAADDAH